MRTGGRIAFEEVWKQFRRGPAHDSLRDMIPAVARALLGRKAKPGTELSGAFWALRDVSFDVQPGQCLGIIGGNGAGKSTTLKILTGILQPTRGRSILKGRVGSLIEVAAGFHQDLTGRENVFLQGAIMGMARADIRRRFDEIVEFSGVGEFIDTPVKRFSSGMNARLGFSIAVHLEPEAVVVDEVLSVGDASFQQRAFDRLSQLVRGQIPAVIVSHQLERITELCDRCLVLETGSCRFIGTPREAIAKYLAPQLNEEAIGDPAAPVALIGVEPHWEGSQTSGTRVRADLRLVLREAPLPPQIEVLLNVTNIATNTVVYRVNLRELGISAQPAGEVRMPVTIDLNLPDGSYGVQLSAWDAGRRMVIGRSAFATVSVLTTSPFSGPVQMNARLRTE